MEPGSGRRFGRPPEPDAAVPLGLRGVDVAPAPAPGAGSAGSRRPETGRPGADVLGTTGELTAGVGAESLAPALSPSRLTMLSASLARELSGEAALSTVVLTAAAAVPAHSTPSSDATVIHLVCT